MMAFVCFGSADHDALRSLAPTIEPLGRAIVERFYSRIQTDENATSVLRDDAQVERLKLTLIGWLRRMLNGPWDDEYYEMRARIGRVHVEVALPQRFMLLAMSVIRVELHKLVESAHPSDAGARLATHEALNKILDIDLAIMLETYRADSLDAARRLEEVERRLIARELEVSEERSRALLDTAEIIAIAVDARDSVVLFNRHAELTTGYSRTEILDRADLDKLWHPSDGAAVADAFASVRDDHASRIDELRMVSRAGETRLIRWHLAKLPAVGESDVCLVGVDLTSERELAERTRRAESLATLGTLAAGLAHEIRNPLNAAQLQLTVAKRRMARGDERASESLTTVDDELGRLATLVGDFLAYAGPRPVRLHPCDLAEATGVVVDLLREDVEAAGVELELRAPEAVAVDCDEHRIRQVLINLVRNGCEAAGVDGRVEVVVERRGPAAVISVSDTGPGLPNGVDIFEPFATSTDSGTGLGLSIAKRIASDHGGEISARRVGEQTVFELAIPIAGKLDAK